MKENFIIANRSDVGKTRQVNEDCMTTFDSPNGRVVVVCDGMGGQAAGDIASQLACDIITDIMSNNTFPTPSEAITHSCLAANQGILHRANLNPELHGMGATCVMIVIKDGKVSYGWIGDSRIYYICDHTIKQLSHDQSFVQTLVDKGEITAEEAKNHPNKNEITNALGFEWMTPPQLGEPFIPDPGSILLLCSDGLTGMVSNNTIADILSSSENSLSEKTKNLVEKANDNGGIDNITVQLVQFKKPVKTKKTSAGNYINYSIIGIIAFVCVIGAILLVSRFSKNETQTQSNTIITEKSDNRSISNPSNKKSSTQLPVKSDETIRITEYKKGKTKSEDNSGTAKEAISKKGKRGRNKTSPTSVSKILNNPTTGASGTGAPSTEDLDDK